MKILITGACGFIGSHLAKACLEKGHDLKALDNLSSGHEDNIKEIRNDIDLTLGDIRDFETLSKSMEGCEAVFHEAALVSVFDSIERPDENHDINISGTFNVLEAALSSKVRRVIFASSAAVYGNDPNLPKKEDMIPSPESPYALAKLNSEYYCKLFSKLYGLETISLRYFNVYGPRQDPSSMYSGVISKFTDCILKNQKPTLFGDGKQSRDFVYVKDIVQANLAALNADKIGQGECINIATGQSQNLIELLQHLSKIKGEPVEAQFEKERPGDIKDSSADISKAKDQLGYEPTYSLESGLREYVESIKI